MGVWKLVDHPSNHKTIKCRWTYVLKSDGCYKARLVVKGYTSPRDRLWVNIFSSSKIQINRISIYRKSPCIATCNATQVVRYKSIRYLLTHATLQDWEIKAMDVKLAYLHGVLEEEIYMEQPEGFIAQGEEDKLCRLLHSLYGLKQAGWVWNRTFISIFTSFLRHLVPACTSQKSLEDTRCASHVIFEASSSLAWVILLHASPQAATSSPVNGVWRQVQVATANSWLSQAITAQTRN